MYLKKTPTKNGRISLSAVQGYRDNGRVRQRTIETFGYIDELQAKYPDPVAHFTKVVASMDAKRKDTRRPQTLDIKPLCPIDKTAVNLMVYGDAVPAAFYHALGIEPTIRSNMRGRGCRFDANALLRIMVMERLLEPDAKEAAWQRAPRHFYRADLSESDVFRGLDELARMAGAIVSTMTSAALSLGAADAGAGQCCRVAQRFGTETPADQGLPAIMFLTQDLNGIPLGYRLLIEGENELSYGLADKGAEPAECTDEISQAFRANRHHLNSRTVYSWTPEHIKAHFLLCYIAFALERIIEHALGHRYAGKDIVADLRAQICLHAEGEWWLLGHRSDLTDQLFALIGETPPRKWMTTSDLKAMFTKDHDVKMAP